MWCPWTPPACSSLNPTLPQDNTSTWCSAMGLCICFPSLLHETSQKTLFRTPIFTHSRVLFIVRGIGSVTWDEPLVGAVISWAFPQSLLSLYPLISFRQEKYLVEVFVSGLVSPLHWKSFLASGGSHFSLYITLWYSSARIIPIVSPQTPKSLVSS